MPSLDVKEPKLALANRFDITVAIEDSEGVAIFEDASTIIRQRR
jgi:hypothetical protein